MSFRDAANAHYLGPDRLKPVLGTSILRASVDAKWVSDLCTGPAAPHRARPASGGGAYQSLAATVDPAGRARPVGFPDPARLADASRSTARDGTSRGDLESCSLLGSRVAGDCFRTIVRRDRSWSPTTHC